MNDTSQLPITPAQAIVILSNATEPGAQISRRDYVLIERALAALRPAVETDSKEVDE